MYLCTCHFLVEPKLSTEYTIYVCNGERERERERAADFLVEIDIFECADSVVHCASALSELISDVRTRPGGKRRKTALFF